MIFCKQDDKVMFEIDMNNEIKDLNSKQPEQTTENSSFTKLYR